MLYKSLKFNPDPYGSHMQIAKRINSNSRVLDVGCATGALGNFLIRQKNCEVYGIEISREAAQEVLKNGYKKVLINDLEQIKRLPFSKGFFDVIICADILEHLKDPHRILKMLKPYLRKGGYLIISIPNIANWYSRLRLLFGKWEYDKAGLFDRTHLRFFNFKTAKQLITDAGFKIEEIDYAPNISLRALLFIFKKQKAGPVCSLLKTKTIPLLRLRYYFARIYPRLFAIQFIIKAKK